MGGLYRTIQCLLTPLVHAATAIEIGPGATNLPVSQISKEAGDFVHFSGDSQRIHWSLGPNYYTQSLDQAFGFLKSKDSGEEDEAAVARLN